MMGDPGDNISAEDAAQIAYAYLAYGEGADGWRIILEGFSEADGCEGYAFSIGQGEGDGYAESFGALVTYDGGVYARKAGETEYTLFTNWK